MAIKVNVQFDGRVFVPLAKVKLRKGQVLTAELTPARADSRSSDRMEAFDRFVGLGVKGASIDPESLRRANMCSDRI